MAIVSYEISKIDNSQYWYTSVCRGMCVGMFVYVLGYVYVYGVVYGWVYIYIYIYVCWEYISVGMCILGGVSILG